MIPTCTGAILPPINGSASANDCQYYRLRQFLPFCRMSFTCAGLLVENIPLNNQLVRLPQFHVGLNG